MVGANSQDWRHWCRIVSFLLLSDDRFILKQMPRLEVQSFLDFAPHYFTYITGAVQQKVRRKLHKNIDVMSEFWFLCLKTWCWWLKRSSIIIIHAQGIYLQDIFHNTELKSQMQTFYHRGPRRWQRSSACTGLATRTPRTTPRRNWTCSSWKTCSMDARWLR